MPASAEHRLVILAGPSCVGKSPLVKAMKRHVPDLAKRLRPVVLYNDRAPRPGEVDGEDYHFRSREQIEALRDREGLIVMEVRGDLQAVDTRELTSQLESGDLLYEGNPFVGSTLLRDRRLAEVPRLTMFMSPLSQAELRAMRDDPGADPEMLVADVMRRKLLRRTQKQKGVLALPDLENIETRCRSAYDELKMAHQFDYVIVNHDGEDSENWDAFRFPLGDARRALHTVIALLRDEAAADVERWDENLLG